MSKGTVLITGVNGYIAAVVASHLLATGYTVRGTVRRLSSAEPLVQGPLKEYADKGSFQVVQVPDITAPGAFDDAVKGVTAIAHLASPVSFTFTDPEPVLKAAVQGTQSVLASAHKAGSPTLHSFVLLSSIVAMMSGKPAPYTLTSADWNTTAVQRATELGRNTPGPVIYGASKTAAERAFWAFREQEKPAFSMTALNPVFVVGPPLLPPRTEAEVGDTVRQIWTVFKGAALPVPIPGTLPHVVDVRDIATLIGVVLEKKEGVDGERFIAAGGAGNPQSIADILREAFPEARGRIQEGNSGEGYKKDYGVDAEKQVDVDSSPARALLPGGEWIAYDNSIIDTARAFEGLASKL